MKAMKVWARTSKNAEGAIQKQLGFGLGFLAVSFGFLIRSSPSIKTFFYSSRTLPATGGVAKEVHLGRLRIGFCIYP